MIKAIIFDFFGVLCSDDYWKFVKEDKFEAGKFHDLSNRVNLGQMSWENFLQKVAEETGQDVQEVERMYNSEKVNPQLAAYIYELHKKYKTALLTNAHASFIKPLLKRTGLATVFDETIISSEIGIIKPDPKIYEYALNLLGSRPEQTVFIDDATVRVEGARRVGMKTVLYKEFDQFRPELEQILLSER